MPWPLYLRERDTVPTVQEAGWAPGQVWTVAENPASTRIRSPDRPARSKSLYQLSNPGQYIYIYIERERERDVLGMQNILKGAHSWARTEIGN